MIGTTQAVGYESPPSLLPATPRPRPAPYGKHWSVILFFGDLAVASAALALVSAILSQPLAFLEARSDAVQGIAFGVVVWLLVFERIGMYRRSFSAKARDEVYASLAACAVGVTPTLVLFMILPALEPLRHLLLATTGLTVLGVIVVRYLEHELRARIFPARARRIAVVGAPERVAAVPRDLSLGDADAVLRFPIDDFDRSIVAAGGDVARLPWLSSAIEQHCNELIVTEALPSELMPKILRITEAKGIKLAFAPTRIRPHACHFRVQRDGGLALLYPQSLAICAPTAERLRRSADVALAATAIVALAPLLLLIAIAVAVDSGFPVIYAQRRVGRGGREFAIRKFRTMRVDAESRTGPTWAAPGESRVTRVGRILRRTSLDELPQLFNVLRGEMAIVGPRPERPFYVEQFRRTLPRYDERHLVRPGITGWSHVHMRRNVDASAIGERLSYDLYYLEHWSPFLDAVIICKTAFEFLFHCPV